MSARLLEHGLAATLPAEVEQVFWARVANHCTWTWRRDDPEGHPVLLALFVDDAQCALAWPADAETPPGESTTFALRFRAPPAGRHRMRLELVHHGVTYFGAERGPLHESDVNCEARAATPAGARAQRWRASSGASWLPGDGLDQARDGRAWPWLVRSARGARFLGADGREWLDWVMGYGACLLGYAHPRVHAAVHDALDSAALTTLPSERELELRDALRALIPCAGGVLLGKNGSDVTTAAVRLSRAHTGRPLVLLSGWHGWQDWNHDGDATCAPPHAPPQALRFPAHDLGAVERLLAAHRGRVAAVMLEPAAQIEGVDGPVRDADPGFLRALAELCRADGALLVFDEVFTAFRWPGGSVQRASGVIPDLACIGKGLAAGFPLAALVGHAELFALLGRIGYSPTFAGECLSIAAALAALAVYREVDVPAHVARVGTRLMSGVDALAAEHGVPVRMAGIPARCVPSFDGAPPRVRAALRTFVQQELLKAGVLTFRGFLLPSLAHGDVEVDATLAAFGKAFAGLRAAIDGGEMVRRLEIPAIV